MIETSISLSMSIGVADYVSGIDTAHDVIQKADKALYTAKLNGKNNVCSAAEQLCVHTIVN